jgi:hypothetical protein
LQIPAILLDRRTCQRAIRENPSDLRTAEKVAAQLPSAVDIRTAAALVDRARSTVGDPPVSRISRMIRVEPGPIPGIRGKAPLGSTRSGRGTSSPRIADAARLYPNIFCCEDCANARSRR